MKRIKRIPFEKRFSSSIPQRKGGHDNECYAPAAKNHFLCLQEHRHFGRKLPFITFICGKIELTNAFAYKYDLCYTPIRSQQASAVQE
jgi:hypothetical protein